MALTSSCAFLNNPLWVKSRALTVISALLDAEGTILDDDFFYQLLSVSRQFLEEAEPGDMWSHIVLHHTLTWLCQYICISSAPSGVS